MTTTPPLDSRERENDTPSDNQASSFPLSWSGLTRPSSVPPVSILVMPKASLRRAEASGRVGRTLSTSGFQLSLERHRDDNKRPHNSIAIPTSRAPRGYPAALSSERQIIASLGQQGNGWIAPCQSPGRVGRAVKGCPAFDTPLGRCYHEISACDPSGHE